MVEQLDRLSNFWDGGCISEISFTFSQRGVYLIIVIGNGRNIDVSGIEYAILRQTPRNLSRTHGTCSGLADLCHYDRHSGGGTVGNAG
jgi:hypothetical protein